MDGFSEKSGKKQRQRNQRDKRKPQEKQNESASPSAAVGNVSDALPQRSNRRHRNEALTTSTNSVSSSTPSENADVKVTTEKENITIDFSNLKRETEEIAKLTKKFAKRNISSNWHRYSAPEGAEDDGEREEEGPADFSALIQVPASRGGHLQLKDELEWSSASNDQLGGYFALDLKLLDQSLACIPLYEQLRLPKNMFTEEQLKHFDSLASEARKVYRTNTVEYTDEVVKKTLTNLLKQEIDVFEGPETKTNINGRNYISISDVHENNQKLLNIDLQPKVVLEKSPGYISSLPKDNHFNVDVSSNNIVNDEGRNSVQLNKKTLDSNRLLEDISIDNLSLISSVTTKIDIPKTGEPQTSLSQNITKITDQRDEVTTETAKEILIDTPKKILHKDKNDSGSIIINDPKEKRMEKNRNRKTPAKDRGENKQSNIETTLKFDDDDDLDFLLSLKKPVLPENKKKSIPDKDSSTIPGSGVPSQTSCTQQQSDLDDWLDSVLEN